MTSDRALSGIEATTASVIQHYLVAAAEEMHRTLVRTAYNTVVYEILDFGLSIYDAELRLVSDSPGLALFLGANDAGIRHGVDAIGPESFDPGDVVLLNYPYWSHAHTLDVLVFSPLFHEDHLRGFAACRAHWLDLGAKDEGYVLDSTDVHQEGVIFPAVKVYKAGDPDREILELIRYNSRMPEKVIGDLHAQVAALKTGERRIRELDDRYGRKTVDAAIDFAIGQSAKRAKSAVAALPDGSWTARGHADPIGDLGHPVEIVVTVSIDGDRFEVDFSESADQLRLPYNDPGADAVAKLCFKTLTTPDDPTNHGHYEPLTVTTREGSIFEPEYPAPTFVGWTGILAADIIYRALAEGLPTKVPASSGGDLCSVMFWGVNHQNGRRFVEANNDGIGWGATAEHDGASALMHVTETMVQNVPIEVLEQRVPVRLERLMLRQDSGGPGKYRGGLGIRRDYRVTGEVGALSIVQKTQAAGWGIDGGTPGSRNTVVLDIDADGSDRIEILVDHGPLPEGGRAVGMMRGSFEAGEGISNRTGGGGGFGDPLERDPEAVRRDVIDGYVSRRRAWEVYGVAITGEHEIDRRLTRFRRSSGC